MAKRSLDQLDRAEALETPPKQPRPRPKSETAQESTKALLMEMQQNVPTLAGRVADFLWHDLDDVRQVGKLAPVQELLLSGREMQLQVMVGIKENRLVVDDAGGRYAKMCAHLEQRFPKAWRDSRKLCVTNTREADLKAARDLMASW